MTPAPSHMSQIWCTCTPSAATRRPPHQHSAATQPALRGPSRSNQCPNNAADEPKKTKNSVYVQPSMETDQSQSVARTRGKNARSPQLIGASMPIARDKGSQNTLK